MLRYDGTVYRGEGAGEPEGAAFCPRCYEETGRRVRLQTELAVSRMGAVQRWHCPVCGGRYPVSPQLADD
ncbi:hypothetical protein [Inmirania thermothiophila]|uniref:Uncharacterized protein n=1 Tax=Inmirania thermothiophila TaxID=1750597 RepID=A0A3N1Y1J2_9GAMM|nr:hypothetical protein [Inmirania thermothiophila]ROR32689.1 hypothetical protein EDC57_1896 [Inmirania thermothiophila]